MRKLRRASPRQTGAVMIWVAVSLVALLTASFLAIDAGRLYFTQRDLQRLASLSAIAGAQVASGCASLDQDGHPGTLTDVTQKVQDFLRSNGGQLGDLSGVNGAPAVELGKLVPIGGLRAFQPLAEGDTEISAVRVNLSRAQPTPFIGFLRGGGTLRASATAEQPLNGSFSVGSTVLDVSGGLLNQTLAALVCPAGDAACRSNVVALNVASSAGGLASTAVSLGQLATAANLSVKDLSDPLSLSTQTVVLPQLLAGLSSSLGDGLSATIVQLLQGLAAATSGNTQAIPLSRIIGSSSAGADQVPLINLFDLITNLGSASHAAGNAVTPIALPASLVVPAGASVRSYLRVLEPAQVSGPARPGAGQARSAQVRLEIRIQTDALINGLVSTLNATIHAASVLLSLLHIDLDLELLSTPLNLGIDIDVAPATAYLDAIECPNAGRNGGSPLARLSVRPAIAEIATGSFSGTPTASFSPPLLATSAPIDLLKLSFGASSRTVQLAFTTARLGGSAQPIALADVVEFERQAVDSAALPPVYAALGGPAVKPVAPVAANPQTRGSSLNIQLDLDLRTQASGPNTGLDAALLSLVSGLLNTVTAALQPVLDLVNGLVGALIEPTLRALGLQLGTATVTLESVQIGRPQKVATCIPGGSGARACPSVD